MNSSLALILLKGAFRVRIAANLLGIQPENRAVVKETGWSIFGKKRP
jgi:hypothetical protein